MDTHSNLPTNTLLTVCSCLHNPAWWRYLGEGMEAVIFEFTPPPSTHICPCPPDIILTNDSDKHTNCNPGKTSLSNNTPKTLILKQICTNSLTDLVLRIPKTNPNHFSTFIQNGDNSFELGGNQKQPRSPIHEYFLYLTSLN